MKQHINLQDMMTMHEEPITEQWISDVLKFESDSGTKDGSGGPNT